MNSGLPFRLAALPSSVGKERNQSLRLEKKEYFLNDLSGFEKQVSIRGLQALKVPAA
jgi:hypothetical protein